MPDMFDDFVGSEFIPGFKEFAAENERELLFIHANEDLIEKCLGSEE